MSKAYKLEALIVALDEAKKLAIEAGLDINFICEVKHLIATAEANKKDA